MTTTEADLLDSLVASVAEAESDTEANLSEKDAVLNYMETLAAQDIALSESPAASNAPVLEGLMALENTKVAASIETQLGSALQAPLAANIETSTEIGNVAANALDQVAELSHPEVTSKSAVSC